MDEKKAAGVKAERDDDFGIYLAKKYKEKTAEEPERAEKPAAEKKG